MHHPGQRIPRKIARALWLAGELVLALAGFAAGWIGLRGRPDRAWRARWLQRICRRALRVLDVNLRVSGPVPSKGLLVCNHLGYLDILVLSATVPCVFISKGEVKGWPIFGWIASLAGTLFLDRNRRLDVGRMSRAMGRVLEEGGLVVLFPEGTSTGGHEVLPFKSSLLEAAVMAMATLSAGFIQYAMSDGDAAEEVCYWKDMTLLPHLVNLLGKRGLEARLNLAECPPAGLDRKQLARRLHAAVVGLKETCKDSVPVPTHFRCFDPLRSTTMA